MTEEGLEELAIALLTRKYCQRADKRQKEMGLSYTEAETRDLARTMVQFATAVIGLWENERHEYNREIDAGINDELRKAGFKIP